MNGLFPGLLSVPEKDRPPVKVVFFAFRIMLALGFFMIGAALLGAFLWWRGTLFETRWYLRVMAHSWWIGFVAVIAGWVVTESGRQPWIVYNIMRTADAISPVPGATIAGTLALFVVAYGVVFSFGIYYMNRLIAKGPDDSSDDASEHFAGSPISAAHDGRVHATRYRQDAVMEWYLPLIWAGVIGVAVAMYIILDGFDLGIGIVFPFARDETERDQMMRSIAPFWDGNETWLVLGGAGLFVAFPRAYADHHAGAVSAGDRDAAGAGVSRHRLRIPHRLAQQDRLEQSLLRRLDDRRLRARRDPRRHDPGH